MLVNGAPGYLQAQLCSVSGPVSSSQDAIEWLVKLHHNKRLILNFIHWHGEIVCPQKFFFKHIYFLTIIPLLC